jgi:hypothetical protein
MKKKEIATCTPTNPSEAVHKLGLCYNIFEN